MGSVVYMLSLRKEGVKIQSCYYLPRIILKVKSKRLGDILFLGLLTDIINLLLI